MRLLVDITVVGLVLLIAGWLGSVSLMGQATAVLAPIGLRGGKPHVASAYATVSGHRVAPTPAQEGHLLMAGSGGPIGLPTPDSTHPCLRPPPAGSVCRTSHTATASTLTTTSQ